jgi:RNA polymerase sigma-70 factor (ECF subfamily)
MTAGLSTRHAAPPTASAAPPPGPDPRDAPPGGEPDGRNLIDTLVARAVTGDPRARDELLAVIHPLVLRYCRARLGRQESLMGSADDVAQDVCIAVISALPTYRLRGLSFRAFVYGIAAHKVTDAFRAIGRNRAEPVADLPDGPVTADGPEHRLLAAETSAQLGALLDHLTPRQREVLVLRLAVGLSAEETAQAVRSTPGAVRVTQHRALGRLRRILLGESAVRVPGDPVPDDPAPDDPGPDAPGPQAGPAVEPAVAALDEPLDTALDTTLDAALDTALDAALDDGPGGALGPVRDDDLAALLDGRVPVQADRRAVPVGHG